MIRLETLHNICLIWSLIGVGSFILFGGFLYASLLFVYIHLCIYINIYISYVHTRGIPRRSRSSQGRAVIHWQTSVRESAGQTFEKRVNPSF